MSRHRPRASHGDGPEDSVALSGWLYADLLLGLAAVFLALAPVTWLASDAAEDPVDAEVATAEPSETPSAEATPTEEPETLLAVCKGLAPEDQIVKVAVDGSLPDEAFVAALEGELIGALTALGHAEDSTFGLVIAFGQGPTAQLGAARERARVVAERLSLIAPHRFGDAATRAYWGGGEASTVVELELFPWVNTCADGSVNDPTAPS